MNKKQKMLWLAPSPGLYKTNSGYNGGGWIASLQKAIQNYWGNNMELSIVYPESEEKEDIQDGVTYYGVPIIRRTFWKYDEKERNFCIRLQRIVEHVNPDIILCFGTEKEFGLVTTITHIPVLIHLQGILNPLYETWLPEGMSWGQFILKKDNFLSWLALKKFKERERRIFKSCQYVIGRTEWDKKIATLMAPQSQYFYGGELLRPAIYNSKKTWHIHLEKKKKIVSIISGSIYKGGDVILRAAKVLKDFYEIDFEWNVYGVKTLHKWEKLTDIGGCDVNVKANGVINEQQLIDVITEADVFVHPSYIENSPNTVCEAQILGIPVIATNSGGTPSIVGHRETGLLVPANDPYQTASAIVEILRDRKLAEQLSEAERSMALERHNPKEIVTNLKRIVEKVIDAQKT